MIIKSVLNPGIVARDIDARYRTPCNLCREAMQASNLRPLRLRYFACRVQTNYFVQLVC